MIWKCIENTVKPFIQMPLWFYCACSFTQQLLQKYEDIEISVWKTEQKDPSFRGFWMMFCVVHIWTNLCNETFDLISNDFGQAWICLALISINPSSCMKWHLNRWAPSSSSRAFDSFERCTMVPSFQLSLCLWLVFLFKMI